MKSYTSKIFIWLLAYLLIFFSAYQLLAQTTINSFPYTESFESGNGAWSNITGDAMDWTRKSGATSSGSTGPSSAYNGSYYFYTEASSPNNPSKTAWLRGPILDLTNYSSASFAFNYHMYGSAMGTLYMQVSLNGTFWFTLWSKSGDQGNSWKSATVDLGSYVGNPVYVRFTGVTGSSYTSDMSIDYIRVTGEESQTVSQIFVQSGYSEGFESGSGTWDNDDGDDIDWTRLTGSTPSSTTGPTSSYEGNYFYYTEATSNVPYKSTYLRGPDFTFASTVSSADLTFRYHLYGADMGNLTLEASTDGGTNWTGIWSEGGSQSNSWQLATISLNDYLDDGVSLRFLGVTGTGYRSDIAVDDIDITVAATQAVVTPSVTENYVLSVAPQTKYGVTSETNQSIQYYDGLGRAMQTIQHEASPNQEDIISSLGYDDFGRQHRSYLPFEKSNNDGEYYASFASTSNYTSSYGSTDDDYAFGETIFEPSPLNRTHKQRAPGYHWRNGQNREVKMEYGPNTSSEVKKLTVANVQSGATPSNYTANHLHKTTTWDENQTSMSASVSRVIEFTDKLGNVVCKKTYEGTTEHATYYVYDDFNNLRYVIPPKADVSNGISSTELDELCFQYTYDARSRMITKKVPGADAMFMVYDTRDRLVLTQDGVQRAKSPTKQWIYTKYDQLNRPIMTGIYESNSSHNSLQTTVMGYSGSALYESFGTGYTDGYSNTSFPTSGISKVLTVTYYDNYDYLAMSSFGAEFDFNSNNGINDGPQITKPKGLATGGKTRMLNDNTWLLAATFFDDKLRPIQSVSETLEGKYGKTFTAYDFTGKVTDTKTIYTMDDDSQEIIAERYEYDHSDRLINTWHSVDGQQEILLAQNEYDALGRLIDKNLHSTDGGSSFDQSVDYRYNVRGWLTSINNAARTNDSGTTNDDSNDLFGMELSYQSSPSGLSFGTQYNGNISGMRWSNEHYDGTQKSYGFVYDGLNRLEDAYYKEKTASTWNVKVGYFDAFNISYDKNGNIETLMRKDNNSIIDNLGYSYISGGNQLKAVNDVTTNIKGFNDREESTTEYMYDENGNMTRDYNKEIQSISYNMLNLPEVITFEGTGKNITYYYDAAGVKWRKKVTDGGSVVETDYIGNMILEEQQLKLMHTAEGRIAVDQVGGVNDYKYQYALKDHLGNNRVTFGATEKEYLATMESELSAEEEAQFSKIAEYRTQNFVYNHTTSGELTPDESIMLNSYKTVGGQRRIAGAMKGLKIQANDVVDLEVYAKHASTCGASETSISTFLFSALTTGFGISSGGETQQAYNALSSLLGSKTLINQSSCDVPAAYLNYIFFDDNYTYKWSGTSQVTSAANGSFEQLSLTFNAGANSGYLYIYVSNESSLNVDVYFDDMKITHNSNLSIVNAEDYYPFGLTFNSYQDVDETEQNFLYNGKELQDDLNLDWYDYGARMYDAAIGRWNVVDPLSEIYHTDAPYAYVLNNPLKFIDPDGRKVEGVTKDDAQKVHEDLNKIFANKRFDKFRALISRSGRRGNGKDFNEIDSDALADALDGLEGEDLALAEMVAGAINSEDVHTVEFAAGDDQLSSGAVEGYNGTVDKANKQFGREILKKLTSMTGENLPGGSGMNFPVSDGSHSVIRTDSNYESEEGRREIVTIHEVFGHGIPSAKRTSDAVNNRHAIQTSNLVRRVLGIKKQRDGSNHSGGKISNPSALPKIE